MSGLTWNPMHGVKRPQKPRYAIEAQQDKIEHSEGWPHYDQKGNCICLNKCCMGPGGCICRACKHIGHEADFHVDTGQQG